MNEIEKEFVKELCIFNVRICGTTVDKYFSLYAENAIQAAELCALLDCGVFIKETLGVSVSWKDFSVELSIEVNDVNKPDNKLYFLNVEIIMFNGSLKVKTSSW